MQAYQRMNILEALRTALEAVSTSIVYTDRVTATTTQQDSSAVIKLGSTEGKGAYGDSYVTVRLFAKDLNGLENCSVLATMEASLYQSLPINNSLFYTQNYNSLESKSDGNGFHYLTIYFDLILK